MTTADQMRTQTMPCRGCGAQVHYGRNPDRPAHWWPLLLPVPAWEPRDVPGAPLGRVEWRAHACPAEGA